MNPTFADYQQAKADVLVLLHQVRDFLKEYATVAPETENKWKPLSDSIERLQQEQFNLVVAGEFSSGKSFLINVLIGAYRVDQNGKVRGLLPDRISPTTSAITVLKHGKGDRATVFYDDGGIETITIDQLSQFIADPSHRERYLQSEEDSHILARGIDAASTWLTKAAKSIGPQRVKPKVRRVELECDSPLLAQGVCLIDTPGTGSVVREHAEVTAEFIPQADAIIFLFPVQPPINKPTQLFLSQCAFHVDRMFFVQTMKDREYVSSDGQWLPRLERGVPVIDIALQENLRIIQEVVPEVSRVYSVSAKWYALSQYGFEVPEPHESGIPQLLSDLETFLVRERGFFSLHSHLHRAQAYVQEAHAQIGSLIEAKQSTIAELERRLEQLKQIALQVEQWRQKVEEEIHLTLHRVRQHIERDYVPKCHELTDVLRQRIAACNRLSELRALEIALPLSASTFVNLLLHRWGSDLLHSEMNELYERLRLGSLAKLDVPHEVLQQLPERTRHSVVRFLATIAPLPDLPPPDAIGRVVRSTVQANVGWWHDWLARIPLIGDLISRGKVEQVKQQLLHSASDMATSVLTDTKQAFVRSLEEQEEKLVSGMKEQLQSFLSQHLTPIERELAKEESERQQEASRLEVYRQYERRCLELIRQLDTLQQQLKGVGRYGTVSSAAADAAVVSQDTQ